MKYEKSILLILLIIGVSFTSGCWNYREIDEMTIVSGVAIDYEDEKFVLTIESITPKGGQDVTMTSDLTTAEGATIFDAIRNLIMQTGRRVYWAHGKVIIISEEIARAGITPVLDYVTRDAEVRENMWLVLSKEKDAKSLLEGKDKMHDTISVHIDDMLQSQKSISKYNAVELWRFLDDLTADGISPTMPMAVLKTKRDAKIPLINGIAIFKRDRMVGELNGIEARSLLLTKGELKGGVIVVPNVGKTNTDITLEVFKSKTKVKPELIDGKLMMKIDVKLDVNIAEIKGTDDFISEKGRKVLQKEAEELVKMQIENTIKKVQKQWASDVFDFGGVVQREMPDYWKAHKNDWDKQFAGLIVKANAEINIRGSALTSKPIKVGE
ncbi:MAG: Ger(x)C family spore germination protein [Anaerosolibacter sp.]|jgi:spore germination protein KC|uniref:Ger(x)C family spore germination protein n=1 Tax=Anaerosolibacter sp. TaxID=1872527 RepID=UPI00262DB9D2|nr:Ger(x)C family spore germination protein [Anaerosolibacter sp.]MDF2547316.1 Ger(x)C family spore germination protein [Anaerosolibacter sp.]